MSPLNRTSDIIVLHDKDTIIERSLQHVINF